MLMFARTSVQTCVCDCMHSPHDGHMSRITGHMSRRGVVDVVLQLSEGGEACGFTALFNNDIGVALFLKAEVVVVVVLIIMMMMPLSMIFTLTAPRQHPQPLASLPHAHASHPLAHVGHRMHVSRTRVRLHGATAAG